MPALSIPNTFSPSTTILSAAVNSNFTAVQTAVNNVDNSQIGSLGIYASQLIPTNGTQATFGGAQRYAFANGLTVTGALSVSTTLAVTGTITGGSTVQGTQFIATTSGIVLKYTGGATGTGFYQDNVNMAVKVTNTTGAFYIENQSGAYAPLYCGAITSNATIQTSGVLAYGNATLSSAAQIGLGGGSVRGITSTAFYVYISSIGQQCAMDTVGNLGLGGGLWAASVTSAGAISGTTGSFTGAISGTTISATAFQNSTGSNNLFYNIQIGQTPGAGQFGILYSAPNAFLETEGYVAIVNHGDSLYMPLYCGALTCSTINSTSITCTSISSTSINANGNTITAGQVNISGGTFNGSGYAGGSTPGSSASFSCLSGGNGIIELPSTSQSLYIRGNGGAYCPFTAGTYTNGSDIFWKEDVADITYGLSTIMQLRPRSFVWKESKVKDFGFIAQEAQTAVPEHVTVDDNGKLLLGYTALIPVLTKAIQEQQAMIHDLQSKVDFLSSVLQSHVAPDA